MRLLFALCVVLIASPAWAEFEMALYGGGSFTNSADVSITAPGTNMTLNGVSLNQSGTIGGKVGYWFTDLSDVGAFGMGIDVFSFTPNIDQQRVSGTLNGRAFSATLAPINLSVIGIGLDVAKLRLHLATSEAFPHGQFHPTLSVGPAIFKTSVTLPAQSQDHTSVGVKVGVGVQYLVTQMIGLFGEYRFTHFSTDATFQPNLSISTALDTHHLVGGVALHF